MRFDLKLSRLLIDSPGRIVFDREHGEVFQFKGETPYVRLKFRVSNPHQLKLSIVFQYFT